MRVYCDIRNPNDRFLMSYDLRFLMSYDTRNVYATGVTAALLLGGCQCHWLLRYVEIDMYWGCIGLCSPHLWCYMPL